MIDHNRRVQNLGSLTESVPAKCIGIGCFWFAAKGVEETDFEAFRHDEFLNGIKETLESVDNISSVRIVSLIASLSFPPFAEQLSDDYDLFPIINGVEIAFDIFMPKRLQEEYSFGRSDVEAEHFQVSIKYGFEMPVAYISYNLPDGEEIEDQSPSTAVVLIRKYLEKKLQDATKVKFQLLGPSPFHADFIACGIQKKMEASTAHSDLIEDISERMAGYRRFVVKLDTNNADVSEQFIEKYHEIFESFYYMTGYRVALLRSGISAANAALLQGSGWWCPSSGWGSRFVPV